MALWWFTLYAYLALPWMWVKVDFSRYTPADYSLVFTLHLLLVGALVLLCSRARGRWRLFYGEMLLAFALLAAGNLIQSVSIDGGYYTSGSFYDTPFLLALVWFTVAACSGARLRPREERSPEKEVKQTLWTARIAMIAIASLPMIALFGSMKGDVPEAVEVFRLKWVFGAMFVLGSLTFWKLSLIARELRRLVELTQESIENVKVVQARITQSQKLAALGRLAAGAAHEISNPLTAILGYSELLGDIPTLTEDDCAKAVAIREQVYRAQSAVNSLRNTLRTPQEAHPMLTPKQ